MPLEKWSLLDTAAILEGYTLVLIALSSHFVLFSNNTIYCKTLKIWTFNFLKYSLIWNKYQTQLIWKIGPKWTIKNTIYKNMFCVSKRNFLFLSCTQNICLIWQKIIIIIFGWLYIFLCLPQNNSTFRHFKIKPYIFRTSNLRDSTLWQNVKY